MKEKVKPSYSCVKFDAEPEEKVSNRISKHILPSSLLNLSC